MAAGQATAEEVLMKNGVTLNPSFLDYKVPLATEMIEGVCIDIITNAMTERDASSRKRLVKATYRACSLLSPTLSRTPLASGPQRCP